MAADLQVRIDGTPTSVYLGENTTLASVQATRAAAARERAEVASATAEAAGEQAADLVRPENIFIGGTLAAAEAQVSTGTFFKWVPTPDGIGEVRQRILGGSDLLYQEFTKSLFDQTDVARYAVRQSKLGANGSIYTQQVIDNASAMAGISVDRAAQVVLPPVSAPFLNQIELKAGVSLMGWPGLSVFDFSAAPMETAIVAVNTSGTLVSNIKIICSGQGQQPANGFFDPASSTDRAIVLARVRTAGSGIVFANVTKGRIENVIVEQAGGTAGTGVNNGVAGIWLTWGCTYTTVEGCNATLCRNGINEDNFFGQEPKHNKYLNDYAVGCRFGIALDSGDTATDTLVDGCSVESCLQSGIDLNKARRTRVVNNYVFGCGIESGNSGIFAYGTGASPVRENDISNNTVVGCFGHSIKLGPYAYFNSVTNNILLDNAKEGVFLQGILRENNTHGNIIRGSGQNGIRIAQISESIVSTGTATIAGTAVTLNGLSAVLERNQELRGAGIAASTRLLTITSQSGGSLVGTVTVAQTVGPVAVTVYKDVGMVIATNSIKGNMIFECGWNGILAEGGRELAVDGNVIKDNGKAAAGTYDGIRFTAGTTASSANDNIVSGTSHRYCIAGTDSGTVDNKFHDNTLAAGSAGICGFANWQQSWQGNGDEYLTVSGAPTGRYPNGFSAWNNAERARYTQISDGTWAVETSLSGMNVRGDVGVTIVPNSSRPTQYFDTQLTATRNVTVNTPPSNLATVAKFRVVRGPNATSASGTQPIVIQNAAAGLIKSLTVASTYADIEFDDANSVWRQTAGGAL